jgi:hypothetical protein
MKITFLIAVLLAGSIINGWSQDVIYLFSGKQITGKVMSINKEDVFYHPKDDPVITKRAALDKVVMIVYENGSSHIIAAPPREPRKKDSIRYGNNLLSFHLIDLAFEDFTLSYERILKSGKLGIQIPISIGVGHPEQSYYNFYNTYAGAFVLNYYPAKQRKFNYFNGLMLQGGYGTGVEYVDSNYQTVDYKKTDMWYGKFLVNNGIYWNIAPTIRLSAYLGLGLAYYDKRSNEYLPAGISTCAKFSINMSCRF